MSNSSLMKTPSMRSDSQNRGGADIMEVLQKAEMAKKSRPGQLPALESLGVAGKSIIGKPPTIGGGPVKGFESNKPVKVMQ